MGFTENVKRLRLQCGLTQKEFGESIGVSAATVSTWEIGTRLPRMGVIERIASTYGILKSDLIEDRKTPTTIGERISKVPVFDEKKNVMNALFDQLTPEQQNQVIVDLLTKLHGQPNRDAQK